MPNDEVQVGNGNGGAVFIKVSNKDIFDRIVALEKKVQAIDIKLYGIIGGFIAAGAYLIQSGGA